jgi:isopentenyldiphosphate isomerase
MIVSEDMLLDTVDDADNVIGVTKRSEVLSSRANFRVAHLLLFNREQELLLQQLSLTRERHPGAWGSSVAAYVASGENYAQSAARRLRQELAITIPLIPLVKTAMMDEQSKKFIMIFTGTTDGPFTYDHEHIARLEYRSIPDVLALREAGARVFTPTFLQVLDTYRQQRHQ